MNPAESLAREFATAWAVKDGFVSDAFAKCADTIAALTRERDESLRRARARELLFGVMKAYRQQAEADRDRLAAQVVAVKQQASAYDASYNRELDAQDAQIERFERERDRLAVEPAQASLRATLYARVLMHVPADVLRAACDAANERMDIVITRCRADAEVSR